MVSTTRVGGGRMGIHDGKRKCAGRICLGGGTEACARDLST